MPSRRIVWKPPSSNFMEYVPSGRLRNWYSPSCSETTVRSRSCSDGLLTVTVTPGTPAPDSSTMRPRIAAEPTACACAVAAPIRSSTPRVTPATTRRLQLTHTCVICISPKLSGNPSSSSDSTVNR